MTAPGTTEPVSWLKLERYHLGELSPEDTAAVERALADDPKTRECLAMIQQPVALPPRLQEAVGLDPRPEVPGRVTPRSRLREAVGSPWSWTMLAAAAAAVLYIALGLDPSEPAFPRARSRIKGGDVAIELVRERQGTITMQPRSYAAGDRFKVQLTCPPAFAGSFVTMVVQDGEVFFPLSPMSGDLCGNGVPLPGAFSLSGSTPTAVCVTWNGLPLRQGSVEPDRLSAALRQAVCVRLEPDR